MDHVCRPLWITAATTVSEALVTFSARNEEGQGGRNSERSLSGDVLTAACRQGPSSGLLKVKNRGTQNMRYETLWFVIPPYANPWLSIADVALVAGNV